MTGETNRDAEYPETPELGKMVQFTDKSQCKRSIFGYLRGKWKDESAPSAKIVVTAGDDAERYEVKGDSVD